METGLAFLISFLFGLVFQVPRNTLVACGLSGAIGWYVFALVAQVQPAVLATMVGAIAIGVAGEGFARYYKTPVTVFVVVGFIPLVPGVKAYNTILLMTYGQFNEGMASGLETMFTAAAIGLGLSIVSSVARVVKERTRKNS